MNSTPPRLRLAARGLQRKSAVHADFVMNKRAWTVVLPSLSLPRTPPVVDRLVFILSVKTQKMLEFVRD